MKPLMKGDRVRLNAYGRKSSGLGVKLHEREGIVRYRSQTSGVLGILWDGRKSIQRVFEGYLEKVRS